MSETEIREQEEQALESVGVRTLDEIHLPGDGPPQEEPEPEAEAQPAEEAVAEEAEPAPEEGDEEAASVLETVRTKLQEDSGQPEEAPAQDVRDLELAQLRHQQMVQQEEERKALAAKVDALEAELKGESTPSVDDGREARIQAAARYYEEKFDMEPDDARNLAITTAEQARIESDLSIKEKIAPIEERWAQQEAYQAQYARNQQASKGLAKGVTDLARVGGTELELAQDFQRNGFNSFLGRALAQVAGNDAVKLTELLASEGSAAIVEQAGSALARRLEAYAGSGGNGASQPVVSGSGGLPAKASARSRGATKPTPKPDHEKQVADELEAELGGAEADFPFLSDSFNWKIPGSM
jgi:hypothetical protein